MIIDTRKPIEEIEKELADFFVKRLAKLIKESIDPGQKLDLCISRERSASNDFGDFCSILVKTEWTETELVQVLKRKSTPL